MASLSLEGAISVLVGIIGAPNITVHVLPK